MNAEDLIQPLRNAALAMADTLEARADTRQTLTIAEIYSLAAALRDMGTPFNVFDGNLPTGRAVDQATALRPTHFSSNQDDPQ